MLLDSIWELQGLFSSVQSLLPLQWRDQKLSFFLMLFTLSVSLHLGNELRLVSFPSELPHIKPWLWCLWGFHCCTGMFVLWSLYFYSKPNWKRDTFSSYWVCKEPKSRTKPWSTGGCLSLRWFSTDFIHINLTLVKAGQYYCQFTLVNTEKKTS